MTTEATEEQQQPQKVNRMELEEKYQQEQEQRQSELPVYCGVCSMPLEYCQYNEKDVYEKCLKWAQKNHPDLLSKIQSNMVTQLTNINENVAKSMEKNSITKSKR